MEPSLSESATANDLTASVVLKANVQRKEIHRQIPAPVVLILDIKGHIFGLSLQRANGGINAMAGERLLNVAPILGS